MEEHKTAKHVIEIINPERSMMLRIKQCQARLLRSLISKGYRVKRIHVGKTNYWPESINIYEANVTIRIRELVLVKGLTAYAPEVRTDEVEECNKVTKEATVMCTEEAQGKFVDGTKADVGCVRCINRRND